MAWCNLSNVGGPWILAILVICDVIEWILAWILGTLKLWKICCIGLVEQIHDVCGKFVGMCKSYFMSMAKFCGYGYGKNLCVWVWKKICNGMKFWSLKNFIRHEIFFGYPSNGSNTFLHWFFRWVESHWLMPPEYLWRKGLEILNLRTNSKDLDFVQVKKETLKAAPLEVGRGVLRASGLGVPMVLDFCF